MKESVLARSCTSRLRFGAAEYGRRVLFLLVLTLASTITGDAGWSLGQKTILCIRINYPDDPREPITEADVYALLERVNEFYVANSYGAASLTSPTVTPVLTMPHPKEWYRNGFPVSDVWDVAAQAGFYRTNYDIDCTFSAFVGLNNTSNPGTKSIYLIAPSVRSVCHELGHVYGMPHADAWEARGNSIIGPGTELAYGNPFDTMGGGDGQFNVCFKSHVEWLAPSYIQDVASSDVFRVYAFDTPALTNGLKYALRIDRGSRYLDFQRYLWLELRRATAADSSTRYGPLLFWGSSGSPESSGQTLLLDTNPDGDAQSGFLDSALTPGRTFSDPQVGVHVTTLRKNGTVPESVEVRVNLGFFTNNHPPTVELLTGLTNAGVGESITFSANASDPDGDEIAYSWEFGDGRFAGNDPSVTQSWPADGEFVVRCAVTDMKGGTASAAVTVRIGNPKSFTVSGRVRSDGQPVEGVRVALSPDRSTRTSSDGSYTLTGLAGGHYRLLPEKAWYQFSPSSLNIVPSNQSIVGTDFVATTNETPNNAPFAQFASPLDGSTYLAATDVELRVDGYDDGSITAVDYYEGTNLLGQGVNGITWSNIPAGQYVLRAVATDELGLSGNSPDVAINVVAGPPANDAFADRIKLTGAVVRAIGYNVAATIEPGEPMPSDFFPRSTVWYSWTAPSNGLFSVGTDESLIPDSMAAVYTGNSIGSLVRIGFGLKPRGPAIFQAEQNVTYQIGVDSISTSGTIVLGIRPAVPPANDNFEDRIAVSGSTLTVTGNNVDATLEVGEPQHGYNVGGGSIWWSWVAPEDGAFTISTTGKGFRTYMAVYTGTNIQSLAQVAHSGFNEASFRARAGIAYQIAADGEGRGEISLDIRRSNPPPNDDFANRISLSGGVAVAYGSTVDASMEPAEPMIQRFSGGSLWWSWTAPFNGWFQVVDDGSAAGSLGIYHGNTLDSLSEVISRSLAGAITFEAEPGTTYQIKVDGAVGADPGSVRLRIYPVSPRFESVSLLPNGDVKLALAAEPERWHVLEASSNLTDWIPVMTNMGFSASVLFTNPGPNHFDLQFYRSFTP